MPVPNPGVVLHLLRSTMLTTPTGIPLNEHAIEQYQQFAKNDLNSKYVTHILSSSKRTDVETTQISLRPVLDRGVHHFILPTLLREYAGAANRHWSETRFHISQVIEQLALTTGPVPIIVHTDQSNERRNMIEVAIIAHEHILSKISGPGHPYENNQFPIATTKTYFITNTGTVYAIGTNELARLRDKYIAPKCGCVCKIAISCIALVVAFIISETL